MPKNWREKIAKMNDRMIHRGPDAEGIWADENVEVVLGHRRLSIIDLSAAGNQPMLSHNGQLVMVLNGEIYNHLEMKRKLETEKGVKCFRGHSDTEVLLEHVSSYGFEKTMKASIGMFAVGVFDREKKKLYLGRDRIGEKPLYYGFVNNSFVFASEISSICEFAGRQMEIDRDALTLYFLHGYIPAPYTIYKGICKMEAGSVLEIAAPYTEVKSYKYWDIMEAAKYGLLHRFKGTEEDAADELERLLKQSVGRQMAADVPVGAFLSGGVDSSAVVAVMQSVSKKKVKTFSIGFEENEYDEAQYAKNTAKYLGTDHTELYVASKDVTEIIPKMPRIYGEPFADSSQLPTYLVSKLARSKVTVSLSGDAGDELFCGYNSYAIFQKVWDTIKYVPLPLRKMGSVMLHSNYIRNEKIRQVSTYLDAEGVEDIYVRYVNQYFRSGNPVLRGNVPKYKYSEYPCHFLKGEDIENVMLMDMLVYHPDDILTKVDRSAMAVSLESRVPFLDKDIVEFAFSLPHEYKADKKMGKKVLRNVLYRYVPREMIDRPKKGFEIPVDQWVRNGQLTEWAEDLMDGSRIRRQGILEPGIVRTMWENFKRNGENGTRIWWLLMFQEWVEKENRDGSV